MNNINRARYILQSTLYTLFIKLREAASASKADLSSFDWLTQKSKDNASFLHWKGVINLVLLYVRFICEVNFKLNVEVLYKFDPTIVEFEFELSLNQNEIRAE